MVGSSRNVALLLAACVPIVDSFTTTVPGLALQGLSQSKVVTLGRMPLASRPTLRQAASRTVRPQGITSVKAVVEGYTSMMSLDSPLSIAAFLFWSVPLPLFVGAILRVSQGNTPKSKALASSTATSRQPGELGIQRNLMWAFPSFGCLLENNTEQPPLNMPAAQRWAWLLNSWGALGWYLYYKYQIEEELKDHCGEGLGGLAVVAPFATGLICGLIGEYMYGSLEHEPFYDLASSLFYGGFGWIYVMQFKLYSKVNELYREANLTEPLLVWGLLVPGYNFVTGIRQIHFLSQYWAIKRGEKSQPDAFCELLPFTTKPTLGVIELFTTPSIWVDWKKLGVGSSDK